MGKRFVETTQWDDPWFRSLPLSYKLFWHFLCNRCDIAGVWKVDVEAASFFIGEKIDPKQAIELFNTEKVRVAEVLNGSRWFIVGFIQFQYGKLSHDSKPHKAVLNLLETHKIDHNKVIQNDNFSYRVTKGLANPLQRVKDKEKDKDKDKEKEKEVFTAEIEFKAVWARYPKKLGLKQALRHFKASVKNLSDLGRINNALDRYIQHAGGKDPNYIQHGSTWFNNWQDWVEFEEKGVAKKSKTDEVKRCFVCETDIPKADYPAHFRKHEQDRESRPAGGIGSLVTQVSGKLDATTKGEKK